MQPPAPAVRTVTGGACTVLAACAALLLAGAAPAAAVEYYRSDAHGTRLARLDAGPAAHAGYTLAVDTPDEALAAGLLARRRLFSAGAVVTEWRRAADGDGSVEREVQAGRVVAERRYDSGGRLLAESFFDPAGELLRRAELTYQDGALRRIHHYDAAGEVTATEEYEVTRGGRLRGFSFTPAGAADSAIVHFLFHRGELLEERRREGDAEVILRFRDGEQLADEQWRGEQLVTEASGGARVDVAGATRTETTLDDAGRVVSERKYDIADGDGAPGRLREERHYRYRDDGSVLSLQVVGPSGRETTDYEFGDDGRLLREKVRRRGRLVQMIAYPAPGERVEEVYGAGGTVLRVIWRDDKPIREELLSDGEVVRTRDLDSATEADADPGAAPAAGTS
jgi:hypothetical protein